MIATGGEPVGLDSNELMGDERETQQPSLALGSASAVLGPDRGKFTGVSTGAAMANGGGHERLAVASGTSRLAFSCC